MANSRDTVTHHAVHSQDHRHNDLNHRKYEDDADVCIVGAGAAGGVLAYELSKSGLKVVIIEAGPFWNPQTDFASDELSMTRLGWQDTRLVSGNDPLQLGHNNSGKGVGGGTTHFTGVFLRFHESDFRTRSEDGVGEDWPIRYEDLAPYYDKIEKDIAVSGPKHFPWGSFHGPYPYPEREPLSANAEIFRIGCEKLGIRSVVAPLAINSAPFDGRPPCINRGFCNQGCLPNAKFSTLIHHIPKAIQHGAEVISDSMVTQIQTNEDGRVTGVTFVHEGKTYKQKARIVILANFVVETPRLLLHSANARFPDGLANSSGWVGKAIMPHSSNDVYGIFPEEIRLYKGTPVLATTQDFYETDSTRGFARGYTLHAHGSRPVEMAKSISKGAKLWGSDLRKAMLDYNFYGRITLVGEVLPDPANRVTLAEEKDEYDMPLAHVSFSYGENDKRLINHAVAKMNEIIQAAGGIPAFVTDDTAHLMGGCRMGNDPQTSVTNGYGQTHDIPNLFVAGASLFVTSGGGNPTNTVMALAARTADYIVEQSKRQEL
ncbi:GMC family oxidoreductase [Cohnella caldifontis]|uniref:GMC family oxidoreductase n=1 Tax=Cohnella caldifontis TaxID=3027471 RepID=UPI0023EC35E5|nr:GMC family oxidoreductase [Cohnella sp. YIM B05605]